MPALSWLSSNNALTVQALRAHAFALRLPRYAVRRRGVGDAAGRGDCDDAHDRPGTGIARPRRARRLEAHWTIDAHRQARGEGVQRQIRARGLRHRGDIAD